MRIAVVGGSITGCALAASLRDHGHELQVFERSTQPLQDRGAGIVTPVPVIDSLRERGLIDADMPMLFAPGISHVGRQGTSRLGRLSWQAPVGLARVRWNDLYGQLRRRVADEQFHGGQAVRDVRLTGDPATPVELVFEDGRTEGFDLAVFADGYRSRGREQIFPASQLRYPGYCLFRGTLTEAAIDDVAPLEDRLYRISYAEGHAVFYLVAGESGDTRAGHRLLNWGMYLRLPEAKLGEYLVDIDGHRGFGSVPFGRIPPARVRHLLATLTPHLPPYFADLMAHPDTRYAIQVPYTCELPACCSGRVALAGDAGMMAPPFTGSGVFKGMTNATELADCLGSSADTDSALERWNMAQTDVGRKQTLLGTRLADALIWNIPDFAAMSADQMAHWWDSAAKFPDEVWRGRRERQNGART